MNTNMFLDYGNSMFPERIAICADDKELSYAQLYNKVGRIASALKAMGCVQGSRIAFIGKNSVEAVALYYAVSRLGAVFAPIDPYASTVGLCGMLHNIQPNLLFIDEDFMHLIPRFRERVNRLTHIVTVGRKHRGLPCFSDLLARNEPMHRCADTKGGDPNVIAFTSGVVDKPKAVVLSHESFISLIRYKLTSTKTPFHGAVLLCVPFCHIIGLAAIMGPIYSGRTLVIMRHLLPDDWLVLVNETRVTTVFLQPHLLARIIRSPLIHALDISSLRIIHIGGDTVPPALVHEAVSILPDHVELRCVYGLTETTFDAAILTPKDDCGDSLTSHRFNSIGKPLPDVEMRVLDEQNRELPTGETGAIWIRTPRAMLGYIDRESLEFLPLDTEWIETGDLGYKDKDGFFYLTGERTHGSQSVDEEVSKRIIVYPSILPYPDAVSPYLGEMTVNNLDSTALSSLVMSAHLLHTGLSLEELKCRYFEIVPKFFKAYAYGIQLWLPGEGDQIIGRRRPGQVKWWAPGKGQFEGSLLVIAENSGADEAYVYSDNVSCKEFVRLASPDIWAFIPLYNTQQTAVGILAFSRSEGQPPFNATERYMMRMIANHICVAAVNAIEHSELADRYALASESLNAAGIAAILSKEDGATISTHNPRKGRLADVKRLDVLHSVVGGNIDTIASGQQTICAKKVVFSGEGRHWYRVRTMPVNREAGDPPLYLSVISLNDAAANFEAVEEVLDPRELEVLEGISKGQSYDEIAENMFISSNTVKYHLRKMYQKLGVRSKSDLLIKAYGLQVESGIPD